MELIFVIAVVLGIVYFFRQSDKDQNSSGPFSSSGKYRNSSLSANERRLEYRRRGKSPSGVIDAVYNDMYRENGRPYNDMDRDWDADA